MSEPGLLTGPTVGVRVGGKGDRNHNGAGVSRGHCLDGAARARVPNEPSPRAASLIEILIHGPVGTRPHAAEASLVERVSPDRRDRRTVHLQARVTDHLGCIDSSRRLPQQDSMREGQYSQTPSTAGDSPPSGREQQEVRLPPISVHISARPYTHPTQRLRPTQRHRPTRRHRPTQRLRRSPTRHSRPLRTVKGRGT